MKSSWVIAIALSLALGAWLATPYVLPAKEAAIVDDEALNAADATTEADAMRVQTRVIKAETIRRELVLNGHSEAARRVILRAEVDGRVIDLPRDKGDYVSAGALVAALDERDKRAWETRAQAMLKEREIQYEAARRLGQKGFQADTKVAEALAMLEEARAILAQSQLNLDHAKITASFAGLMEDRMVEIGDFVQMGDPLAEIIELDPIIVTADVPEIHYHRFTGDALAEVELAGFEKRQGRVHFLSGEADADTRTFHLEIELPNPDFELPAGVSALVSLAFEAEQAHRVEPSLLALDDAGRLGIKHVDPLGIVAFAPAEIIKSDVDAVWLAGLPDEIVAITIGQGFVKPGERVIAVPEDEDTDPAPVVAQQ